MVQHYKMLIGGKWVDAKKGGIIEVVNPATEEVFASVPAATKEDVEEAILKAQEAFFKMEKGKSISTE